MDLDEGMLKGVGFIEVREGPNSQRILRPEGFDYGFMTKRVWSLMGGAELPPTTSIRAWCAEQFDGEGDWTYYNDTFWFRSTMHATAFKLRWM